MKKFFYSLILIIIFSVNGVFASNIPTDWAMLEVSEAINLDLVIEEITKDYQRDITREEFCELIIKLYEKIEGKEASIGADRFIDTDNSEVLKAYSLGIVAGISDSEFAPTRSITREEMCVMLTKCIDMVISGSDISIYSNNEFKDKDDISSWAIPYVNYAYDNKIIAGIGDNKIAPKGNTTCEQAIVLVYHIYKNKDALVVYDEITKEEILEFENFREGINEISKKYEDENGYVEIEKVASILDSVESKAKELKEKGEIVDYSRGLYSVLFKLNSGIRYICSPKIEGFRSGSGNDVIMKTFQPAYAGDPIEYKPISTDASDGTAKILADHFAHVNFYESNNYNSERANLEAFKNWGENQFILIEGHGNWYPQYNSIIVTGEKADSLELMSDDVRDGIILIYEDMTIAVTSKFFNKYIISLDGSFIYLGICLSAYDDVLANTLISKGAEVVLGNTNTIDGKYNCNMMAGICRNLTVKDNNGNYYTVGETLEGAKEYFGATDQYHPSFIPLVSQVGGVYSPAAVKLYGNPDYRILDTQSDSQESPSVSPAQVTPPTQVTPPPTQTEYNDNVDEYKE